MRRWRSMGLDYGQVTLRSGPHSAMPRLAPYREPTMHSSRAVCSVAAAGADRFPAPARRCCSAPPPGTRASAATSA